MRRRFVKWLVLCLAIVMLVGVVPRAAGMPVNAETPSEWVVYQKGCESKFSAATTVLTTAEDGLCAVVPVGEYMQFQGFDLNLRLPQGMDKESFAFYVKVYIHDEASLTLFTEGGGQFELYNTQFDVDEISWNTSTIATDCKPAVGWNTLELSFAEASGNLLDAAEIIDGFRFYAGVGATKNQARSLTFGEMKIIKRFDAADCPHETVADGATLTPSTCTTHGEAEAICRTCGTAVGTRPLPLAECRWDYGKRIERPTMDKTGVCEITCLVCGKVKYEEVAVLSGLGDVNGDRKIDSTDARITLQYAVQKD